MDYTRDVRLPPRYRVLSQLGRGAQGVVYEALDLESETRVALKTVDLSRPEQLVRFKHEFRALRDLRHPNLLQLGELTESDGQWFFTMELVDGVDFLTWVRGPLALEPARSSDPTTIARAQWGQEPIADTTLPEPVVDAAPAFDEARLRHGLADLAGALAFIHAAGKVHRDLKPSNVLVTADGRLVLIDFGVVAELADQDPDRGLVIGTSVYMAPEQARGESVGPASDWYAFGVLLFEALTGRPPFRGASDEVQRLKCSIDAPPPGLFADGIPRDLERLCMRLLARDAVARPRHDEIARALGVSASGPAGAPGDGAGPCFVGRVDELVALHRAFAAVCAGEPRALLLEGPSGVGKSELVARFIDELRARHPQLLVLAGRCHEQERVPYNAVDALVDGLARFLAARSIEKLLPLIPPGADQLGRLFPVLKALEPIARASLVDGDLPPAERGEAFAALRTLLVRVARSHATVLFVDDLHWADGDSLVLLAELLRGPDAPPLLFLASARAGGQGERSFAATALGPLLKRVAVAELPRRDAEALARALAARHAGGAVAAGAVDVAAILGEAGGHPLFVDELVRHVLHQPHQARARTLDDAIFARACAFSDRARQLLQLVAVAGAPIEQQVAAQAAALSAVEYHEHVAELRAAHLVRISGTRRQDTIEPYHDRVRETIYAHLDATARARLHRQLADVLEANDASAELLFTHFDKAGEHATAARHAERAAAAAARALAFDGAAALYLRALELGGHDDDARRRLLAAAGDALAAAGRSREAAETFRIAAATGAVGREELLELRRRAAEQLLMGGHLEPGLEATRALLAEFDLELPAAGLGALARVGWRQARLTLKPLRWTPRREHEIAADARALLDVYWSVGAGLSLVESVRGMLFVFGGALLALDLGDQARIARALSTAAIAEAGLGSRARAQRLVSACRRAAEADGGARARFYAAIAEHASAFLLDNDWSACLDGLERAIGLWRASGRAAAGWEWDASEQFACWSLANLGRLRALGERVPARIRAAQRLGNRFMEVNFRAFFAHVHLLPDRPDEARRDVEDAIASWLPGSAEFGNQQFLALRSRALIALYAGDVEAAAPRLDEDWARYFRSLLRHVPFLRQDALTQICGLALARAALALQRHDAPAATQQSRAARRALERLARIDLPMARAATLRLRAGLAALDGDDEAALGHLRAALLNAEAARTELHVAVIRLRLGALVGGSEGETLCRLGRAWMAAEGVVNPARMTASLLPGWPHPG